MVGQAAELAGLLGMSVIGWSDKRRSTDFLPAANDLPVRLMLGDAVYAPQTSMFWGLAWYMAEPEWESPLEIANLLSEQWQRVYARLGAPTVDLLHFASKAQVLDLLGQVSMIIGNSSQRSAETHRRVWLVTYPRAVLPTGYPLDHLGALKRQGETCCSILVVSPYEAGK